MKKRILVLILALTIPFSVMGCGRKKIVSISDSVEATDSGSVEKEQTEEVDNSLESTETVSDENIEEMPEAEMENNMAGFSISGYTYESGGAAANGYYIVESSKSSLYGLVDAEGNFVIPAEYDEMEFAGRTEDRIEVIVKMEGKYGVYDNKNQKVIPMEYDLIRTGEINYLVTKDKTQSVWDFNGNCIKELNDYGYDSVIGDLYLKKISLSEGIRYFDMNENITDADSIEYNSETGIYNILKYSEDPEQQETYQLIDENGEIVYEVTNRESDEKAYIISSLSKNMIKIARSVFFYNSLYTDGPAYFYNLKEQKQIDTSYTSIYGIANHEFLGKREDGIDIYDEDGNKIHSFDLSDYESIQYEYDSSLIVVQYGETWRVYDEDGNDLMGERFQDVRFIGEFLELKNMDGECGVIDEKGNVVIPFGDLYEVDYDETYQGEEIKAMSAVAGKLYVVTEKTRDDLLNLHIF